MRPDSNVNTQQLTSLIYQKPGALKVLSILLCDIENSLKREPNLDNDGSLEL